MSSDAQGPLATIPLGIWHSFRKNYSWLIADQALVSGANFILSVVIARLLGPEGFGHYSLIVVILLLLEIIQRAFIATPMMTLAQSYQGQAKEDYLEGVSRLQNSAMIILVPLTALFFLVCGVMFPDWGIERYFLTAALFAGLRARHEFFRRRAFVMRRPRRAFFLDSIAHVSLLFMLAVFYYLEIVSLDLVLLASACAFFLPLLRWRIPKARRLSLDLRELWARHLKFGKWMAATLMSQWMCGNYMLILMASIINPQAVGGLKAAITLLAPLNVLAMVIENIVPIQASHFYHQQGAKAMTQYLARACLFIMGLNTLLLLVIIFPADYWLDLFFGYSYRQYAHELRILGWVALFTPVAHMLAFGLRTLHDTRGLFFSHLAGAVVSVGFGQLILKQFGTSGYAYSMVLFLLLNIAITGSLYANKIRKAPRHG